MYLLDELLLLVLTELLLLVFVSLELLPVGFVQHLFVCALVFHFVFYL